MGVLGDVLSGRINKAVFGIKTEIASDIRGTVRGAIDPGLNTQQQGPYGVQPRQPGGQQGGYAAGSPLQRSGMSELPVARQPGITGGQPATLGDTVGGWMARLVNSVAPVPGGITDRVTRGAVTNATIAAGAALNGGAAGGPQNMAPVVDRSTYSAALIAEAKANGRDTSRMVQTPEARPVVATPDTPSVVETFAVSMPSVSEARPLPPLPSTPAATTTAPAAVLDTKTPAITTSISPKEDFKEAASPVASTPAAPAVQAPAAEFHSRFSEDTYARARAQVAKIGEPVGMG